MTVRRGAARLVAVGVLLGGVMVVGATPALADDSVKVRAAGSFTAGASPGSVSVEVRRRTEGCVLLRTALRLRLPGVRADQVEVQVSAGGQWWPVPVSGGGVLSTARTSPANPTLCKGKSVTVRYRVAFLPGAPAGKLTVAGEVTTAGGKTIGRASDTSLVRAGRTPTPTPSPTPTKSPTPSPTPAEVTSGPTEASAVQPTLAAVGGGAGQAADSGGSGGGLSLVMVFGIALVVAGLGLIALLFRRSRADRRSTGASAGPIPPPLSGPPGGTTYRSRGTVYPSAPQGDSPSSSGTVYPTSSSGPRYPESRSERSGTVYPASRSGYPGTPPPPSTGDGDSTTVMPRLPD